MSALQMQHMLQGLVVQRRVIKALILREVHTIYGDTKLGYLWVLIQSAFGIGVFWVMRELLHAQNPHGMPVAVFLILGFGVWYVISGCINKCMNAVRSNLPLLTFPQVTELDVMLGRVIVICVTQLVVTVLLLGIAAALDIEISVYSPRLLFICFTLIPVFGLGCGTLLSALAVFIPSLERIVPLMMRLLFFASGVFFSATSFTKDIADILSYNPILQLVELTRCAFSFSYPRDGLSLIYISAVSLSVLTLGLLLERYVRTRRQR